MDRPNLPARYDDRQMALILKLAAADAEALAPSASGHTLEEIEAIATEVGIPAEAVRRAALALAGTRRGVLARVVGAPTRFQHERVVPVEIDVRAGVDLLQNLSWTSGKDGTITDAAGSIGWRHRVEEGPVTQVMLSPRDGATRVRVVRQYDDPAAWIVAGGAAAAAAASTVLISALDPSLGAGVALVAASAGGAWAAARALYRGVARRAERKLSRLADAIADRVGQAVRSDPTAERAAPSPARPPQT